MPKKTSPEIIANAEIPSRPVSPVEFFTEKEVAGFFRVSPRAFRENTRGEGIRFETRPN